jgi:uncharacterized membrane protein YqjE
MQASVKGFYACIPFVYCTMFSATGILETLAKFLKLDGLVENLTGYVEARVKLLKLEVREEVARVVTQGLLLAVFMLIAFLMLVFISIAVALFINQYTAHSYVGFLTVAGLYLLVFILTFSFRKQLHKKLEQHFAEKLKHH